MQQRLRIQLAVVLCSISTTAFSAEAEKPNVVIVITDDQGYGDVAFTGNPAIKTPNIDDNMARLMDLLETEGIADNTILVFMTDNGTAGGLKSGRGYDGGMRGKKNSEYDGGHRVPFIIRWPNGKIEAGKSVERLTAHIDILPTFIELCGLKAPEIEFDGSDISDLLYTDGKEWPDRALVVESQRVVDPIKWRKSAVMTDRWRLVNGKELYDLQADPKQTTDLTATPYYAYVTHKPTPGWQIPQGMGIPVYDPTYGRVPPQMKKR